ncbi:MAG: S8 family serine peptidase [Bryobacteraceae bacterium]
MQSTKRTLLISLFLAALAYAPAAFGATPPSNRWLVILNEPPAAQRFPGKFRTTRATAEPYRQHLRSVQTGLRSQIEGQHVRVTGGIQHLMNGLFVVASPTQAAALRNLPGVKSVVPMRWYRRKDQLTLSNVAAAWNNSGIGGASNAGAGLFIGVVDTGIDQTNPSFNQALVAPEGYPVADTAADLAFTSNKVIVARSYVSYDAVSDETDTANPDLQSRPDDLTARDLVGHGTGVASVIAGQITTVDGVKISGVAPMAYLGNYKVFGSDEVNGSASEEGLMQAVEDAVSDGVDVINVSSGYLPTTGPLDESCDGPCDPFAYELETAVEDAYVVVVAAAGNDANIGYQYNFKSAGIPTLSTIATPAYAPSVIAAGGIQNDVTYTQSVDVSGSGVPANLQAIAAVSSADGPQLPSPASAPLVDVTQAGDSEGMLCDPISPGTLTNDFVLVLRGSCDFSVKVGYAQNAGALGVVFADNGTGLSPWSVGTGALIPAFLVSQTNGSNLKAYIDAHSGANTTLNPNPFQAPASTQYVEDKCDPSTAAPPTEALIPESVACFASLGPSFGVGAVEVKPDAAAAATDFLLAVQSYDPEGELFNFNGYGTADGTSFSTPMFSGAAALVIQANPTFSPEQVKSALVNTASASGLLTTDGTAAAPLVAVGAGLLQAQNAVASTVQFIPSSVYFGVLNGSLASSSTAVTVINSSTNSLNLSFNVAQPSGLSGTQVQVNGATSTSLTIPATSETTVTVSLSGSVPGAGRYEGLITVTGASTPLTFPYTFVVSDNTPYDIIPLDETPPGYIGFDGPVSANIPWYNSCSGTVNTCSYSYGLIAVQVIDRYGAPVADAPVQWSVTGGNGSVLQGTDYTDTATNIYGIAGASVVLGSTAGPQEFTATVNGMSMPFDGNARIVPAINSNGIVDAASFTGGRAVAPGSWISIYGTHMSDVTDTAYSTCPQCSPLFQPLPLGLDGVAFSFDTSALSLPGRFSFVSPDQLNVQVPWELTGQSSATVKVIVDYTYSALYNLPIAEYSPGFFVINYTTNEAAALLPNYSVVSSTNPVPLGTPVLLYLNGLGPVNNPPADGMAVPGATSTTTTMPTVTIGGQSATVTYSGLAPGLVGYQVNAVVPTGISAGMQPIALSIGGVTAKTAYIYVN